MADTPWLDDTCSLTEAFRSGARHPADELDATLAAVEASELRAFTYLDPEPARARARQADPALPLGGVPVAVKELEPMAGWPYTEASLVFAGRTAGHTSTMMQRVTADGGAVAFGQTTASEFGGLNVSISKANGITGNAWDASRTAGGSSGGSAAAVSGGLCTIASGGDGGGSIRIPAGFNGLVGMKGTAGRIPRGPKTTIAPLTVVVGCLARSVRDVCRWYDVAAGYDMRDPYSLPRHDRWERDLGTHDLSGMRVAILPDLDGAAVVRSEVADLVAEAGEQLARVAGLQIVDGVHYDAPGLGFEWALSNLVTLQMDLMDAWPECRDDLTDAISFGMQMAEEHFDLRTAARAEEARTRANEAMAAVFDQVDFVVLATNPDVAYPADCKLNTRVGDRKVGPENNGALTIPANIVGTPSCSVPVGTLPTHDGASPELPVGMQIMGRHHQDALVLDLALALERARPWPLVAPGAPC